MSPDLLSCAHCKPPRAIFRAPDGLWTHRDTGFISCFPEGAPNGKTAEPSPAPAGRPSTPPREDPSGGMTITIQRACNGCGTSLGNATAAELDAAAAGRPQPDVTDECPSCSPGTWVVALAAKSPCKGCEQQLYVEDGALLHVVSGREACGPTVLTTAASPSEVWDGTILPGGYVCAAPVTDGPSILVGGVQVCGMPVESEPCPEHGSTARPVDQTGGDPC